MYLIIRKLTDVNECTKKCCSNSKYVKPFNDKFKKISLFVTTSSDVLIKHDNVLMGYSSQIQNLGNILLNMKYLI